MKNEKLRNLEWKENKDFVANKEIFTSDFPCACNCASVQCHMYTLVNKMQMGCETRNSITIRLLGLICWRRLAFDMLNWNTFTANIPFVDPGIVWLLYLWCQWFDDNVILCHCLSIIPSIDFEHSTVNCVVTTNYERQTAHLINKFKWSTWHFRLTCISHSHSN